MVILDNQVYQVLVGMLEHREAKASKGMLAPQVLQDPLELQGQ